MKKLKCSLTLVVLVLLSMNTLAASATINGLTNNKIRSVGDYTGTTFDNSIELWFSTSLAWPEGFGCYANYRVYIDAKHTQMISAAYLAFASGKKVNINADDSLTIRSGSCELSFLDVVL